MAGLGGILAGAGVWWIGEQVEAVVPDSIDQTAFLGPVVQVFEGHFQAAMMPQGVIMLGAGALVTAAGLVWWTGTPWPDLAVAVVIAGLFLQSSWSIVRDARRDLAETAA